MTVKRTYKITSSRFATQVVKGTAKDLKDILAQHFFDDVRGSVAFKVSKSGRISFTVTAKSRY